jgi:hypothetical protein
MNEKSRYLCNATPFQLKPQFHNIFIRNKEENVASLSTIPNLDAAMDCGIFFQKDTIVKQTPGCHQIHQHQLNIDTDRSHIE